MRILAIETSCDETAVALLECIGALPVPTFKVLGNSLFSQAHLHAEYGGVYPNLAKREHEKNLPLLLEKTLKEAGENIDTPTIDCIAVTRGPGLEPALWVGIMFAEELGRRWNKPVVPVNHMEGHLFAVLFENTQPIEFPAISLLVSGGHTELVHLESFEKYEVIGHTLDDAAGEAFDKVARMLGLPYPGGPEISRLAEKERNKKTEQKFVFPRPMIHSHDLNFSYSGLKTAVLYTIKKLETLDEETKQQIALAFEDAAVDVLVQKTHQALETYGAKTLMLGGGVAANRHLKQKLIELAAVLNVSLRLPPASLTTDNAVMIGIAAYVEILKNSSLLTNTQVSMKADGNLTL
jgi:N6-L-threonylcarbamoyladenine synthase